MIRFRTLGAVQLTRPGGEPLVSVASQPKRLALLAYLAVTDRGAPHRRDSLVALFWPELSTPRARAALRKALHYLREGLGPGVIVTSGDEDVLVSETALECDARTFQQAVARGALAEAVRGYAGEFLPGLHLPDVPGFERWLDGERRRLRESAVASAMSLARAERNTGRHETAIAWAQRAVDLSPLEERAARLLIELHEQDGDRAGALRAYARYERALADELEIAPGTEMREVVDRVRQTLAPRSTGAARAGDDAILPGGSSAASPLPPAPRVRRRWIATGLLAVTAGAFAIVAATKGVPLGSALSLRQWAAEDQILVGDFEAQPRDSLAARALSEVLRGALAESRAVDVVSRAEVDRALERMQRPVTTPLIGQIVRDLAARNGYEAILGGAIIPTGAGWVVSARLTTSDGRELATLSETAVAPDALIASIDRLARTLRRKIGESAATLDSVRPLVDFSTRSLRALELYTKADDETRAGRSLAPKTIQLLRDAIAADSSFAMAHRFLGIKLYRTGAIHESIQELRHAERLSDRLTEVERLTSLSSLHLLLLDYPRATDEAERVLELEPDNWWAMTQLAYLYPLSGRYEDARAMEARRREYDLMNRSDLSWAARRLLYLGRYEDALVLAREQLDCCRQLLGSRAAAVGRWYIAKAHAAMSAYDSAEHHAMPHTGIGERGPAIVAWSQLARGKIGKAFATWNVRPRGSEGDRNWSRISTQHETVAAMATFLLTGDARSAARRLDAVLEDPALHAGDVADRPMGPIMALALVGRAVDARRELSAIERALDADMRSVRSPELALARGAVALAERRHRVAVAAFEEAGRVFIPLTDACRICGLPWLGYAFDDAGKPDSAITVYERFLSTGDEDRLRADALWRAVILRRLGELYAERGDGSRAVEYLERFIALWKDADAELQAQVQAARRRVAELRAAGSARQRASD